MGKNVFIEIREGTTSDIDFQLLADDDPIDLTSINHVEMEMRDKHRKAYKYSSSDGSPKVSIVTASSGLVRFTPPDATIFLAAKSPYKGYWRVYETASKNYSVPEDSEFEIKIREDY